jgi:hypothetical protein
VGKFRDPGSCQAGMGRPSMSLTSSNRHCNWIREPTWPCHTNESEAIVGLLSAPLAVPAILVHEHSRRLLLLVSINTEVHLSAGATPVRHLVFESGIFVSDVKGHFN